MRNTLQADLGALIGAIALATLGAVELAHGSVIHVSITPQQQTVAVGDTFIVDITADINSDVAIVAWGMDLSFNTGIVSYDPATDVTLGSLFDPQTGGGDGDGLAGVVRPPNTWVFGQNVLLASVEFTAEEVGTTGFSGSYTLHDEWEGFMLPNNGGLADVMFDGGSIEVIPIPLPAPVLLAAVGLAGVAVLRRKLI